MQTSPKSIKEDIARAKGHTQRGDYLRTLGALCKALERMLQSQIFGRDKFEIGILMDEAVNDLMGMKAMKRIFSTPLKYEKGKEKKLYLTLKKLRTKIEEAVEKARIEKTRSRLARLDELILKAQGLLEAKESLEARKLFRQVSDEHPDVPGINTDIGRRLVMAGLLQEAVEYLKKAIEITPGDVRSYDLLAMCHEGLAEPAKAREVIWDAIRRFGKKEGLYLRLAKLCLAAQDWSAALDAANVVLSINPLNRDAARIVKKAEPKVYRQAKAAPKSRKPTGEDIKLDM